jgi:hypothetical protein
MKTLGISLFGANSGCAFISDIHLARWGPYFLGRNTTIGQEVQVVRVRVRPPKAYRHGTCLLGGIHIFPQTRLAR